MSKIATYLRGHIGGEVSTRDDVRATLANDGGVLAIKPEIVVYPHDTNDIRKVARFAWQLHDKGHTMPLTTRGAGTDTTGAAIGKGALIVLPAHMNQIYEYDVKQKLVRLQPGVQIGALQGALNLYGTSVQALAGSQPYGTVGGAIASAVAGPLAGKYGNIGQAIDQLEVVLANGDVIQTGRINKRELNRRKGMQGFVGDIYRGVDGVIEEYADVFEKLRINDATGYNSIADVKRKDGSFDLTPLFVGSQGTLGVISEIIMRAEFRNTKMALAALVFTDSAAARDALDELANLKPALLEYFDAALYNNAQKAGHSYKFYLEAAVNKAAQSVVVVGFDEFSKHQRAKLLKKIKKLYEKREGVVLTTENGEEPGEIAAALNVAYYTIAPDSASIVPAGIFNGFYIPTARLEEFVKALNKLATTEHLELPLAGHAITNTYTVYPALTLAKVADRQRLFKLLDALAKIVYACDGTMVAEGGEGRLMTHTVYSQLDTRVVEMYEALRKVFDPYGSLNPGVKQKAELATITGLLRSEHGAHDIARYGS